VLSIAKCPVERVFAGAHGRAVHATHRLFQAVVAAHSRSRQVDTYECRAGRIGYELRYAVPQLYQEDGFRENLEQLADIGGRGSHRLWSIGHSVSVQLDAAQSAIHANQKNLALGCFASSVRTRASPSNGILAPRTANAVRRYASGLVVR